MLTVLYLLVPRSACRVESMLAAVSARNSVCVTGFKDLVDNAVDRALAIEEADEGEADRLRQEAQGSRANICLGPPGTGKTTVIFSCIDRALAKGGKVLMALPTAQLASRMKARYGDRVDIDTCHAAFGLHEAAEHGEASLLSMYSLIVVDELSQLDMVNFDKILRLWAAAERVPALALLGDRYQMAGMGEQRPWHSRLWTTMCYRVALHKMYRCKDKVHAKLLAVLRTNKPNNKLLRQLRNKLAWRPPGKPTVKALRKLLKCRPDTTILTCTRRGAAVVNKVALQAFFPHYPPVATLPADVDSNPENYAQGKLRPVAELEPSAMPVYKGMRVYLTRNVRKDVDFVNGMEATVLKYDNLTGGLLVRTAHRHRLCGQRVALDRSGPGRPRLLPCQARLRLHHPEVSGRRASPRGRLLGRSQGSGSCLHRHQQGRLLQRLLVGGHLDSRPFHAGQMRGCLRRRGAFHLSGDTYRLPATLNNLRVPQGMQSFDEHGNVCRQRAQLKLGFWKLYR